MRKATDAGDDDPPPTVPAPDTTDLLDALVALLRRFIVFPTPHAYWAIALFIVRTWAIESAHATPYIVAESPEKQCGKSRVLECWSSCVAAR